MTTEEIDALVHQEIISHDAYPSPLGYGGFPKSVCTSVNNVLCHGIPDSRPLQDGDIINIDVTVYYNGYHGDTSETFLVGNVDECGKKLVEVARRCRDEAIAACRAGAPFSVIGNTISQITHQNGLQVCPHFVGHGIGSYFHGHPEIWHHANDSDLRMEEGMAFTVEPIITEGSPEFKVLEDAWTVVSLDNQRCLLSARFLLNCIEREGSSDDEGELLLPAPQALERLLVAALCVSGRPSSSTQFSSRRGARRS
ncbi:methionine aminopeptidase 1D, mitochondrial isoform X2 [Phocoena sinus]|nr:methionine aminopeptidase 1D, mitochondrial isoform X2 [Phocoena sinus]XP_032493594.1 methionine aminopeptidase 1D, mitochondrial isoform X2 [Phocoena sinus]